MIIESKVVIHVPTEFAFEQMTDVSIIIEQLPEKVSIRTTSNHNTFEIGSTWLVRASRGGRNFKIQSEVIERNTPYRITFNSESSRFRSISTIIIDPISERRCKVTMKTTLSPNGLLGRILIQSLKASNKRVKQRTNKFGNSVKKFLEARYESTH